MRKEPRYLKYDQRPKQSQKILISNHERVRINNQWPRNL